MATATRSFGTILEREISAGSGTYVTVGGVQDLPFPAISREMLDATTMSSASGAREQIPGIMVVEDFTVTLLYDSADATQAQLVADCIAGTPRLYRIPATDTGTVAWSANAYVSRYEPGATVRGLHTMSITQSPTGAATIA